MSQTEMSGEDASMEAATARILEKVRGAAPERPDTRENRADRDPIEQDDYHDLSDLEGLEREEARARSNDASKQPAKQAEPNSDADGEDGAGAEASDDDAILFELPKAADAPEDAEPVRVTKREAAEAVQKLRQMDGDIATAINQRVTEFETKQDSAWGNMVKAHNAVIEKADAVLAAIPAPQPPPKSMLDERSANYDPQGYYQWLTSYEQQTNAIKWTQEQKSLAQQARDKVMQEASAAHDAREHERLGRYIPEWKNEGDRDKVLGKLYGFMETKYGVPQELLGRLPFDHRLIRALNDMVVLSEEKTKAKAEAPKVRKDIQEKAAKLSNGRLPDREKSSGRFISDARKELKERGTEDSFARLLMSSGALKNI